MSQETVVVGATAAIVAAVAILTLRCLLRTKEKAE